MIQTRQESVFSKSLWFNKSWSFFNNLSTIEVLGSWNSSRQSDCGQQTDERQHNVDASVFDLLNQTVETNVSITTWLHTYL